MAVPTGPVGVLSINATLERSQKSWLLLGIGSVFGDMFYSILVVSSMGGLIEFFDAHQVPLKIVSFFLVAWLGIKIMRQKIEQKKYYSLWSNLKDWFTGFVLTITNPSVILSFLFAFSLAHIILDDLSWDQKSFVVLWVMWWAFTWWITLTSIVRVFCKKMTPRLLKLINTVSGAILVILALGILISLVGTSWIALFR